MTLRHLIADRDGVLNREHLDSWVTEPGEWRWEDGAEDGLAAVAAAGLQLSVVTNQSVVGRGLVPATQVETLHAWLTDDLRRRSIDVVGVFACLHAPSDGCRCRKPAPGSVLDAIAASGVDPSQTVLVGDDLRDMQAAQAAGIAAILVRTGKGNLVEATGRWSGPVVDRFDVAVATALSEHGSEP